MDEFTRTLLDTDGQTLVDFILFCKHFGRTPTDDNFQWFLARRAQGSWVAHKTTKKKDGNKVVPI